MPWLRVNQTRLLGLREVPTPLLALEVHLGEMPGPSGALGNVAIVRPFRDPLRDQLGLRVEIAATRLG